MTSFKLDTSTWRLPPDATPMRILDQALEQFNHAVEDAIKAELDRGTPFRDLRLEHRLGEPLSAHLYAGTRLVATIRVHFTVSTATPWGLPT